MNFDQRERKKKWKKRKNTKQNLKKSTTHTHTYTRRPHASGKNNKNISELSICFLLHISCCPYHASLNAPNECTPTKIFDLRNKNCHCSFQFNFKSIIMGIHPGGHGGSGVTVATPRKLAMPVVPGIQ
jgi:hypothetical protein